MKIGRTRRYNHEKRGSHAVQVWMTDWECSITIGALKHYVKTKKLPKAAKVFVERHLRTGFSKALGTVLKAEFHDLKLAGHPHYNRQSNGTVYKSMSVNTDYGSKPQRTNKGSREHIIKEI